MSVVDTYEILKTANQSGAEDQKKGLTDEEYFKAALLGWCIELVSSSVEYNLLKRTV